MKIKDLIKELESWNDYEECNLKVKFKGKSFDIDKIRGLVPDLFITIKSVIKIKNEIN